MNVRIFAIIIIYSFIVCSCNHVHTDGKNPKEESALSQLNSTDNESEMQSNGQGYEYHLDFESMCELMEETEEKNIIKDTITDSDFDGLMQRYFREHLSYPKTGEEFCRKYYMKDKLNGYDYLMSTCDYAGDREDFVHPHLLTYQQYNELMDKLYEDIYQQYQNPLHPYYGLFMNNYSLPFILKPDWQYIYRSQSDITFSIEGDKLLMKNAADGRIFATENYLYTLPRYIEDMHGIPFDVRRITNLNELRQTYAYTSDSIQIELLQFYEYDDMNEEDIAYKIHIAYRIQKNINRLILKYNKSISNSVNIQSKKYILHYKKSGEMTDFFTGAPAPIIFVRNKELTSYLEHLMSLNPRIAFIQFEAFEIER